MPHLNWTMLIKEALENDIWAPIQYKDIVLPV